MKIVKEVPVLEETDVLVCGGGIAGATAAVAASREGAKTILVERFGYLGGNMGPGMFSGGVLHLALQYPFALMDGLKGIPGEFINRCEGYAGHQLGKNYLKDHQVVAYVWFKMMEENNVGLMLNTFACDPIMENNTVKGLVVENKSGTGIIISKVVIDATADADVCFRAGAQMDEGTRYVHPGMYFAIGNVDENRYLSWLKQVEVSEDDIKWAKEIGEKLGNKRVGSLKPFYPLFRNAWYLGEYRFVKPVEKIGAITVDHGFYPPINGIVGAQIGVMGKEIKSGDTKLMTRLEVECRTYIFETAKFLISHVPGFENSYLLSVSPYFHTRGGRSVVTEYVLTEDDLKEGRRFDDVVFLNFGCESSTVVEQGYDFPYRQLLPKGLDGILVAGKSAIIQPPTNRTRWKCFLMGNVAGVAAAMAVKKGVSPSKIDIKQLQKTLYHKYHIELGNEERLKELGILESEEVEKDR